MATIAEHLKAKDTEPQIDWALLEPELRREVPPTVFPRIVMSPAPTVLNLWASLVWHRVEGDGSALSVADVLCSPVMVDSDTKEAVTDPCPIALPKLAWDSEDTYQADPMKYKKGKPKYSDTLVGALVVVNRSLKETSAPEWFKRWLLWRWPDSGRFAHEFPDDADLAQLWIKRTNAKLIMGGLCFDEHDRRAATAALRKTDQRFMAHLREKLRIG